MDRKCKPTVGDAKNIKVLDLKHVKIFYLKHVLPVFCKPPLVYCCILFVESMLVKMLNKNACQY